MQTPGPSWDALHARFAEHGAPFAFVIPVFNHAQNVRRVVEEALLSRAPVFVVDDGSTDETTGILAGIRTARILRHPVNRGKGAAILTGMEAASEAPVRAHFVVTVDADGQHHPDEARHLLASLLSDEPPALRKSLIVGARIGMDKGQVPWSSRVGRGFSGFWVWATGGPSLSDSQSGFRVYPVAETLALPTRARRFEFEVEVLVHAYRAGIPIREAPVSVEYDPPGGRVSHFRPWRDFARNSAAFSRLLAGRFLPRALARSRKNTEVPRGAP